MNIEQDTVVTLDYTLRGDDGAVIDSSDGDPLLYLHGHENIVPGLEKALTGKAVGDDLKVTVPAAEGYGERDDNRVIDAAREDLPEDLQPEVGMMLAMETEGGDVIPLTITAVEEQTVTLDGNHQLAGQTLHFEVSVRDIRGATAEELAHGHPHDPETGCG